jgi:hypothetical protein
VIASRVPLEDAALASRTIHVVMTRSDRDAPELDVDAEEKLTEELQPVLEMFRLLHYQSVATSQHPAFLKFPPRLRDSARALAAPLLGNEELLEQLAGALECQVPYVQVDRFNEPEWVVMLALFRLCHVQPYDVYVRNVTDEINRTRRETGETGCYSPKMVGHILNKSLGFSTRRRGDGYRIALTLECGRKIHRQAKAMGLNRSDVLPPIDVESGLVDQPCDLCSEYGLMTDHEGRRLRTVFELHEEKGFMQCTNCGAHVYSDDARCSRCETPR